MSTPHPLTQPLCHCPHCGSYHPLAWSPNPADYSNSTLPPDSDMEDRLDQWMNRLHRMCLITAFSSAANAWLLRYLHSARGPEAEDGKLLYDFTIRCSIIFFMTTAALSFFGVALVWQRNETKLENIIYQKYSRLESGDMSTTTTTTNEGLPQSAPPSIVYLTVEKDLRQDDAKVEVDLESQSQTLIVEVQGQNGDHMSRHMDIFPSLFVENLYHTCRILRTMGCMTWAIGMVMYVRHM